MWNALIDQIAAVLHSFRHNKGRSFLTLLGMIIGAGSVVLLAGLLAGARESLVLTNQFVNDADVIRVGSQPTPPRQVGRTVRPLDSADRDNLDQSPSIGGGEVEGELNKWEQWAHYGADKKRVMVQGATEQTLALYRLEVERGRLRQRRGSDRAVAGVRGGQRGLA